VLNPIHYKQRMKELFERLDGKDMSSSENEDMADEDKSQQSNPKLPLDKLSNLSQQRQLQKSPFFESHSNVAESQRRSSLGMRKLDKGKLESSSKLGQIRGGDSKAKAKNDEISKIKKKED